MGLITKELTEEQLKWLKAMETFKNRTVKQLFEDIQIGGYWDRSAYDELQLLGEIYRPEDDEYGLYVLATSEMLVDQLVVRDCLIKDDIDVVTTWFDYVIGKQVFKLPKIPTNHIDLGIQWVRI